VLASFQKVDWFWALKSMTVLVADPERRTSCAVPPSFSCSWQSYCCFGQALGPLYPLRLPTFHLIILASIESEIEGLSAAYNGVMNHVSKQAQEEAGELSPFTELGLLGSIHLDEVTGAASLLLIMITYCVFRSTGEV
jgi:hypothetical protein